MTVRKFKNFCLKKAGVSRFSEFVDLSDKHRIFWEKLNHLGARNMDIYPPEEYLNIDETVNLSKKEIRELKREFQALS